MKIDPINGLYDQAFLEMSQGRENFSPLLDLQEIGTVTTVLNGIAQVSGLPRVGFEEIIKFPGDLYGIAFNLDEQEIAFLLGEFGTACRR
ncbi:MAG: hypothetical protein R2788_19545 [Saprospiraceae bacterium]